MKTPWIAATVGSLLVASCASQRGATFATPEDAVHRLVAAAEDPVAAEELLGDGGFDLLSSGDEVADRADLEAVVALVGEGLAFEDVGPDRKLALLGSAGWELPIPLVREDEGWRFDVEAGREEILNRRVGRNELSTIGTLRELVEAQREYVAAGHGGWGVYAARVLSSSGKRDGLFWTTAEGEEPSPLGLLVADAFEEGYRAGEALPYHGYFYRLLTAQGASAPGGAKNYVDSKSLLTGGFAVLAWPATYDNSGVMTFVVNHRGLVFQKDLGPETAQAAALVQNYDPDTSWTPTAD